MGIRLYCRYDFSHFEKYDGFMEGSRVERVHHVFAYRQPAAFVPHLCRDDNRKKRCLSWMRRFL